MQYIIKGLSPIFHDVLDAQECRRNLTLINKRSISNTVNETLVSELLVLSIFFDLPTLLTALLIRRPIRQCAGYFINGCKFKWVLSSDSLHKIQH